MRGTSGQGNTPISSRVERRGEDRGMYGFEGKSDARYDSLNTSRELREGKVGGAGAELKIGGVE